MRYGFVFAAMFLLVGCSLRTSDIYLPGSSYTEVGDISVLAYGTWLPTEELANPTHTVELFCYRSGNYCSVAKAWVDQDNSLLLKTTMFDIEKWTDSEIIAASEGDAFGCFGIKIIINRRDQEVMHIRQTNKDASSDVCKGMSQEPLMLYLGDG